MFGRFFSRRQDFHNGACTAFGDGTHGFFHDIGKAAFFIAWRRVGIAINASFSQIIIIPFHFGSQFVPHFLIDAAGGQHMDTVTHFRNFAEHDRGAALNKHISSIPGTGICRKAGEGVTAATLHTYNQFR